MHFYAHIVRIFGIERTVVVKFGRHVAWTLLCKESKCGEKIRNRYSFLSGLVFFH